MKKYLLLALCLVMLSLSACKSTATSTVSKSLDDVASEMEQTLTLNTEDKLEPAYQMIGAVGGVKYVGTGIEIYEYDTDSDTYKELAKDMKVELEGFSMELTASQINGQYVLFAEDAENKDDIVNAFNEICK